MCLAIPAEILELKAAGQALVSVNGIRRVVNTELTPEARPGDYVVLHVGYALGVIDEAEARRTLALLETEGALADPFEDHERAALEAAS
ncbi:MAG: HypC/HybG/HupF family hydrogenase formation chaperone [Rhizobiaceae bacterium]|jgi:hydrogenase expression/formation protein HypC|nr:HypC/HybG/HupF family hydrogenase formation chaperone [Rhizobiaceae bacterium]